MPSYANLATRMDLKSIESRFESEGGYQHIKGNDMHKRDLDRALNAFDTIGCSLRGCTLSPEESKQLAQRLKALALTIRIGSLPGETPDETRDAFETAMTVVDKIK